jgi:hypothetical protein
LMLGLAHTLVVETIVLREVRARFWRLLLYRLGMSILAGLVASRIFIAAGP